MQTRFVAGGVVLAACSSILAGCGGSDPSPTPVPSPAPSPAPSPPPAPSPATSTTTTMHTTTTELTCHPGNDLDQCKVQCDYCDKAEQCTIKGSIGCDGSSCVWIEDNSTHGGTCMSPHSTTTPATTPSTGCEPHTNTDPCYTRGDYIHSEEACVELGPIGCQHQVCQYFAMPDGTMACGSPHATTTVGPCVPGTGTDKCFTLCASYCTNETSCVQLGLQGCDNAACSWVDGHCQSSSSFDGDFVELV